MKYIAVDLLIEKVWKKYFLISLALALDDGQE